MPLLSSYVPTSHVLPLYLTDPPSFHWNVSPSFPPGRRGIPRQSALFSKRG